MTVPTPTQADYARAWRDLHERLDGGLNAMAVLIHDADAAADEAAPNSVSDGLATTRARRLRYKRTGIDDALTIWDRLNEDAPHTGDYAAAWRTFTDAVFEAWKAAPDTNVQQGLAVALSYQRGYGEAIDAPPLFVLAPAPRG